jgi:hypothetical protein
VGFTISHIITSFEPEALPTSLYLQWANLPGYNDGYRSLDIVKSLPAPGILAFRSLTPEIVTAGDSVNLTWQTFAVARVQLSYTVDEQPVVLDSAANQIAPSMETFAPTPAPVVNTTYNLDAFDADGNKVDSRQVVITVTHTPIKIGAFTASPAVADFTTGPIDVRLEWRVTPVTMIKSLEVEGLADVTDQIRYVAKGIEAPTIFSLRAIGLGGDQHIATARTQVLKDYLVGRTYRATSQLFLSSEEDESAGIYGWAQDTVEFLSTTQARYTIDTTDLVSAHLQDGKLPPRGPSKAGFPKTFTGSVSVTGQIVQVTLPSVGVLDCVYTAPPIESLDFQGVLPFASEIRWERNGALSPV